MIVVGISVGTTRTAVCVLRDGTLCDRGTHNDYDNWTGTKLRVILSRYERYLLRCGADAVVVKLPPAKKRTRQVGMLIQGIEALAARHGCKFDFMTKADIKKALSVRSTAEMVETRGLYPELAAIYEKGRPGGHSYYIRLYEAVVAAHVYDTREHRRMLAPDGS